MGQARIYINFLFFFLILRNVLGTEEVKASSLPVETLSELKHLVKQTGPQLRPNCKKMKEVIPNFLLFGRDNQEAPEIMNIENPVIQQGKKTIVIIHNWLSSVNSSQVINLKDAYLKRYDANVILVDWMNVSWKGYTKAFCATPRMSFHISNLLCNLKQQSDFNLEDLHVVGHGVGAHVAGVVGYYVKNKCSSQIGRITGLDPAGPIYQTIPDFRKLDKGDALFVDVIHTDSLFIGYSGNMGSTDFYVNCAQHQPGCPEIRKINNDTNVNDVMCNQLRSLEYMTESVTTNNYLAYSCILCPRVCRPDLFNGVQVVMGEECKKMPRGAKFFYIATKSTPPYYMGNFLEKS